MGAATTVTFKVRGRGSFPFDMLRYDTCWPKRGGDAAKLEHHRRDEREVTLEGLREPTIERWSSFAWERVI